MSEYFNAIIKDNSLQPRRQNSQIKVNASLKIKLFICICFFSFSLTSRLGMCVSSAMFIFEYSDESLSIAIMDLTLFQLKCAMTTRI